MTSLSKLGGGGAVVLYKNTALNPFLACMHLSIKHCSRDHKDQNVTPCTIPPPDLAYSQCGYILQRTEHVTTMLFICLQKPSMAMPPCHLSSAVRRRKAWKRKTKARKTQVAGKSDSASVCRLCVNGVLSCTEQSWSQHSALITAVFWGQEYDAELHPFVQ